jgi:hypothetical protein
MRRRHSAIGGRFRRLAFQKGDATGDMIITALTNAILIAAVCGTCVWFLRCLPIEPRLTTLAGILVVVVGIIAIVQSLDVLVLKCC